MNIKNPRKSLESSIIIFLIWTNFYFILSLIECAEFCFKTWVSGVKFNLRIFSLYPFRDENYQAGTDFSIPSFNGAIVLKKVFVLCLDIQTSSAWTVSSKLGVTCFKKKNERMGEKRNLFIMVHKPPVRRSSAAARERKCIQKYNASVNNPLSKAACKLHNRLCQVNLNRAISFAPVPTAHSCLSPRGIHHLDCCLKGTSHPSLSQGVTFS